MYTLCILFDILHKICYTKFIKNDKKVLTFKKYSSKILNTDTRKNTLVCVVCLCQACLKLLVL